MGLGVRNCFTHLGGVRIEGELYRVFNTSREYCCGTSVDISHGQRHNRSGRIVSLANVWAMLCKRHASRARSRKPTDVPRQGKVDRVNDTAFARSVWTVNTC